MEDYSAYDLQDEFTVGDILVACTLINPNTCDSDKADLIERALLTAIQKGKLIPTPETSKATNKKHIKIKRSEIKKWFESKNQQPAFLFPEARLKQQEPVVEKIITPMASGEHRPGDLKVIVDDVNQIVIVSHQVGNNKKSKFTRSDIVGKGIVTWDLLVAFAKCNGSLEGNTAADLKQLNSSANRKNLSKNLVNAMNLDRSPIVKGRRGIMRFRSIQLAGGTSSPDAMDRKTFSTDDPGTEIVKSHGADMPVLD